MKKITQRGISFEYEYDSRGNITSEKRSDLTTTYQYDALGQMIRVNDPHGNATWVYNYDCGGNITSKDKYAYTTGMVDTAIETIPYVYSDSNWKDKLTSYDGQTITYDAIGNPTNDGIWSYTWEAGRQLKLMSTEGASVSFKYDHNGMRVQKVVEQSWYPETTNYIYHGKLLTHMTVDYTDFDEVAHQDKMHFFYDAQSRPAKVEFNGTVYTYLYNLQGDIVGILDNTGTLAVEYQYDAWGRSILTCTLKTEYEPLAKRNPFRYRGYVYDEETELYDLRSRYYNPGWKRFINADEIVYGKLLCANVYTYCQNRPVSKIDKTGKIAVVVGWLASGGWTLGLSALKAAGAYALKLLGVGAAAGIAATGMKHISQSVSSSNADERADVQPLPGPAPTYSATPAPKTTLAPNSAPKLPDYPGDDPEVAPEGYEWRGRGPQGSPEGNYHNPTTGESLHPDLNHAPPIGPHWDYWGPDGVKVRIFPPT